MSRHLVFIFIPYKRIAVCINKRSKKFLKSPIAASVVLALFIGVINHRRRRWYLVIVKKKTITYVQQAHG